MEKISDNYKELVDMKMVSYGLDRAISYEVFNDSKYKVKDDCQIGYVIIVPSKIRENTDVIDCLICFNESYLDMLSTVKDKPMLDLAIDRVLNSIFFDFEKDVVKKATENVVEFSSILKKYGVDFVIEEYRLAINQFKDALADSGGLF